MLKSLLIIFFILISLNVQAEQIKKDCLPFEDSNGDKICSEYYEECRDSKGRFFNCSEKGKLKNIFKGIKKKCRSEETGKFVKCPSEVK